MPISFKHLFISVCIVFLILPGCNRSARIDNSAKKPNVLLVMADDMGFTDIGSYGSEINSPHIDRLAQEGTQVFSFGGKNLEVSSEYDCSNSLSLMAADFVIVNVKIPKWAYSSASIEDLNEEFSEEFLKEIGDKIKLLRERKIEFKSFGNKFQGYLYEIETNEKKSLMISSFGIIEYPIYLTIALKNQSLDFDSLELSSEIIELIAITDLN